VVAEEAAPVALTPAMLRKALHAVEIEFQINKADLLQNHYLETRRTPMGRVIFEHYKTSELTISPHSVQALCYDFGVYVSAEEVGEAVKKYASLPGGTMIYQDFLIWWQQHEEIRLVYSLSVAMLHVSQVFKFLPSLFFFASSVKLNDPKFIRQNQAVLCFKKLDPELHGCIPSEALPTLFAILQQNDVIGSKSILATAVLRLDPEQEHVIKLQPFLQWVALVSVCHATVPGVLFTSRNSDYRVIYYRYFFRRSNRIPSRKVTAL
jgi:Ca2+-binding EF-hand superfamily protein